MDIPGDPRNNYIARMEWAGNPNELVIEQLNRLQNTADLLIAEVQRAKPGRFFAIRIKRGSMRMKSARSASPSCG